MQISRGSLAVAVTLSLFILGSGCAAQHGTTATIPAGANVAPASGTNTIPAGPKVAPAAGRR